MARTIGSHAETTGPKVREVALKLFARHGYAAVSMRQIAADVGVQAGALYNYTPDKQSLLMDLMTAHMDELLSARARVASAGQPVARLEEFVRFHIRHHLERPDAVFVSYMELRNLTPENFAKVDALRGTYERELEGILSQGRDSGAFVVPDAKIAALALIAMLNGVTTWYRPGGRLSQQQVEDIYWAMALRSVSPAAVTQA